ncbi:MAG: diadenylate cyclase, partial [Candidatus Hermodarchaeota archaeon]
KALAGKRVGVDDLSAPHALITMALFAEAGLTVKPLLEAGQKVGSKDVQLIEYVHIEDMMTHLDTGAIDAAVVLGASIASHAKAGGYRNIADPLEIYEKTHPEKRLVGPVLVTTAQVLQKAEGEQKVAEMVRMVGNGINRVKETVHERAAKYHRKYGLPEYTFTKIVRQAQDDKIFITDIKKFKASITDTVNLVNKFLETGWPLDRMEKLIHPLTDDKAQQGQWLQFFKPMNTKVLIRELSEKHNILVPIASNLIRIVQELAFTFDEGREFEEVILVGDLASIAPHLSEKPIGKQSPPTNLKVKNTLSKLKILRDTIAGFDNKGDFVGFYKFSDKLLKDAEGVTKPIALIDRPFTLLTTNENVICLRIDSGIGAVSIFGNGEPTYHFLRGCWYKQDFPAFQEFLNNKTQSLEIEDNVLIRVIQAAYQMKYLVKRGDHGGLLILTQDAENVANQCEGAQFVGKDIMTDEGLNELPDIGKEDLATIIDFTGKIHSNHCLLVSSEDAVRKGEERSPWVVEKGAKHKSAAAFSGELEKTLCIAISSEGSVSIFEDGATIFSDLPEASIQTTPKDE